jgi:CheY-like chemotaxis protein
MTSEKSILVVEDEQVLSDVIKTKLEKNGFKVTTARTVEQSLNYLKDGLKIDVIWLDHYLLGQENGLDLVAKIKSDESTWKNIPIFVVSNTASADKVQAYLRLGVSKYYTKSNFRLEDIISDIKEFLQKGE